MPRLQRVILKRAAVRKTDVPRLGPGKTVDCVEMYRGGPIVLTARQKDYARHCRRDVATQAAQAGGSDLYHGGLARALLTRNHHVRFEQHAFQRNPVLEKGVKHSVQYHTGNLFAALDRMGTVHQHFRLDDRNQILFLTKCSIPRQRESIRAYAGTARQRVTDVDHRPPLREAGAHTAVGRKALPEPVEAGLVSSAVRTFTDPGCPVCGYLRHADGWRGH